MNIVIMRHGKPVLDLEAIKHKKIPSSQLRQIVTEYENTDLDHFNIPLVNSQALAEKCGISVCSDLPRAVSSINALGLSKTNKIDPIYREPALPHIEWGFPKLTFFTWAIIFRFAWLCGFSKNGESIQAAKARAKLGAEKLEDLAKEQTSVLHVGHGIMNRLIIKELKRKNWKVIEHTGEKYWAYTVLEFLL